MKTILIVATMIALVGCGAKTRIAMDVGARINDEALNSAELVICQGASIGSIKRRFGTEEGAKVWRRFCNNDDEFRLYGDDDE